MAAWAIFIVCNCGLAGILTYRGFSIALIWLQGLELDISEQTNKNKDFNFLIFDSEMAKLTKKWVNMFQIIVNLTLESKIGFINLGFGTYYDHLVPWAPLDSNNLSLVFYEIPELWAC